MNKILLSAAVSTFLLMAGSSAFALDANNNDLKKGSEINATETNTTSTDSSTNVDADVDILAVVDSGNTENAGNTNNSGNTTNTANDSGNTTSSNSSTNTNVDADINAVIDSGNTENAGNTNNSGNTNITDSGNTTNTSFDVQLSHVELVSSQNLKASVTGNSLNINGQTLFGGVGVVNTVTTGDASYEMCGNGLTSVQSQTGIHNAGVNTVGMAVQLNNGM